ncbi:MAG: GFA family protein [Alphaproteobacteria bacterium]|nr:GFA family protein [Alphaproteobacteria bacterium]
MPVPFSGGCSCGAIRYTCTEEPFVSYLCHCTECQKRTGSAFGISVLVPPKSFRLDKGTPKTRERIADSGNVITFHFCGDCGTNVFADNSARAHAMGLFGGTLDDPDWLPIQANIWTDSALGWVQMDETVERFAKVPDFSKYFAGR